MRGLNLDQLRALATAIENRHRLSARRPFVASSVVTSSMCLPGVRLLPRAAFAAPANHDVTGARRLAALPRALIAGGYPNALPRGSPRRATAGLCIDTVSRPYRLY